MALTKKSTETEIRVLPINTHDVRVAIVGITPIWFNAMSKKAKEELLYPRGRKTTADKATSLKHEPLREFRDSIYRNENEKAPAYLEFPSPGIKGVLCTAALDLPGVTKASIERLTWVKGQRIPIWGEPFLSMDVVRMADIAKTPDIRTRCVLPRWASVVQIGYVGPRLSEEGIVNLLAAGGLTCGIGDWRQEKGSGNNGQFRVTGTDDPEFQEIVREYGWLFQKERIDNPICLNVEVEELLDWYTNEIIARNSKTGGAIQRGKPDNADVEDIIAGAQTEKPRRGRKAQVNGHA